MSKDDDDADADDDSDDGDDDVNGDNEEVENRWKKVYGCNQRSCAMSKFGFQKLQLQKI